MNPLKKIQEKMKWHKKAIVSLKKDAKIIKVWIGGTSRRKKRMAKGVAKDK